MQRLAPRHSAGPEGQGAAAGVHVEQATHLAAHAAALHVSHLAGDEVVDELLDCAAALLRAEAVRAAAGVLQGQQHLAPAALGAGLSALLGLAGEEGLNGLAQDHAGTCKSVSTVRVWRRTRQAPVWRGDTGGKGALNRQVQRGGWGVRYCRNHAKARGPSIPVPPLRVNGCLHTGQGSFNGPPCSCCCWLATRPMQCWQKVCPQFTAKARNEFRVSFARPLDLPSPPACQARLTYDRVQEQLQAYWARKGVDKVRLAEAQRHELRRPVAGPR